MNRLLSLVFQMPQKLLIGVVKAYRLLLSPSLGSACRFEPTCSAYSLQALEQYGATIGSYLTLKRLARCHPWCDGGYDPVPARLKADSGQSTLFTRLVTPVTSISSKKNPS